MMRDESDIDRTIARWVARGVLAPDIARDLRRNGMRMQRDTWGCVRDAMLTYQIIGDGALRSAA